MRVTVLGATGLVGEELLQILGEREFPVGELRCFGSSDDSGDFGAPAGLEFRGSEVVAEPTDASRIADSDLVFCAAPGALEPLLPAIRESGAALVDLSGSLELDPETPLWPLSRTSLAPSRGPSSSCTFTVTSTTMSLSIAFMVKSRPFAPPGPTTMPLSLVGM